MRGQTVIFDGHTLNNVFQVGQVEVGLPDFDPSLTQRVGADGAIAHGLRMEGVEISVRLIVKPGNRPRDAIAALMAWLDVDGPRQLSLSRDRGLYRTAMPSGAPKIEDENYEDIVTVTFAQPDPALYGTTRTVTIPSGGAVSIDVGGTYPTRPTISATEAHVDSTSKLWGVKLDDGDFVLVSYSGSFTSVPVTIDCDGRTCEVAGNITTPTITSDWLVLTPGAHVIRNHVGAGDSIITWVERWHA